MKTFIIAAALAVSAFAFAAPASAAPVAKIDGIHTSSPLTLAQYNRHRTKRTVRRHPGLHEFPAKFPPDCATMPEPWQSDPNKRSRGHNRAST